MFATTIFFVPTREGGIKGSPQRFGKSATLVALTEEIASDFSHDPDPEADGPSFARQRSHNLRDRSRTELHDEHDSRDGS
jgi:hypothetical protein